MKAIYFDMDGTVYDLYGVEGWLEMLQNEDETAYSCGAAIVDLVSLNELLQDFIALGVTVGVITWTAKNGSKEYNNSVRRIKREWVNVNMPCVSEFHCVKYGTPKHAIAKVKDSVLVDDNEQVRQAWRNGETVDASDPQKTLETLKNLLTRLIELDTM